MVNAAWVTRAGGLRPPLSILALNAMLIDGFLRITLDVDRLVLDRADALGEIETRELHVLIGRHLDPRGGLAFERSS